ncbi:MAG: DinB family protein [Acidobacteriaceae bacterium]|nr:DinB family protein [Acidobacteriaceae bacterium]
MRRLSFALPIIACLAAQLYAQEDVKQAVLKHLKTSRDFTLKIADQMPASDYSFKLTPPQMSFAEQLVHLSQGLTYFLAPFSGEKPNPGKPKSMSKEDVTAFVKTSFDNAIETVSKLAPDQISKTYKSDEGTMTGADLLLGLLDHTTHHRASAEMYLRAKGITPAEYQF